MMPAYLYKKEYCPLAWNFEDDLFEGQKHPVIVHFTFVPKPWCKDCDNPYKKVFEKSGREVPRGQECVVGEE